MDVEEVAFRSQTHVWKTLLAFVDSMVLRCAVELGIADIIHSQNQPLSLPRIAELVSPPVAVANHSALFRIMRFLVRKGFFRTLANTSTGETLYSTTPSSELLVRGSNGNLVSMVLLKTYAMGPSPWHCLSDCVRRGGTAFERACGMDFWSYTATHPELNELFNVAMAGTIANTINAVVSTYKDGFAGLKSVVDVGGGTGAALAEITRMYPGIRGINFDRPHVVAEAPEYPGVVHVGGDMFEAVPPADSVFMKWILHCFGDEECVKILKNCKKAIPGKIGKLIIVESVLNPNNEDQVEDIRMAYDMVMLTSQSGKERTEEEWKKLLGLGGFSRYNIIRIPSITSIIEAYPE